MGMKNTLVRLTFNTQAEFLAWRADSRPFVDHLWRWHETLITSPGPVVISGICDLCERLTTFRTTAVSCEGHVSPVRANWWFEMNCDCGASAAMRAVLRAIIDYGSVADPLYHVGHFSPFAEWLRAHGCVDVTTSQFDERYRSGEIVDGVRYEDLSSLSFDDASFGTIVATEILEHLPDYLSALQHCARVLRSGGRLVMTFPFLGAENYEHLTRAQMLPDGTIRHILPPEYHGDPIRADGVLSFRSFGWRILDEMREAGFTRAFARVVFGPLHGHMTLLYPVFVGIR
jgi:SAM-dependent methyltransferase